MKPHDESESSVETFIEPYRDLPNLRLPAERKQELLAALTERLDEEPTQRVSRFGRRGRARVWAAGIGGAAVAIVIAGVVLSPTGLGLWSGNVSDGSRTNTVGLGPLGMQGTGTGQGPLSAPNGPGTSKDPQQIHQGPGPMPYMYSGVLGFTPLLPHAVPAGYRENGASIWVEEGSSPRLSKFQIVYSNGNGSEYIQLDENPVNAAGAQTTPAYVETSVSVDGVQGFAHQQSDGVWMIQFTKDNLQYVVSGGKDLSLDTLVKFAARLDRKDFTAPYIISRTIHGSRTFLGLNLTVHRPTVLPDGYKLSDSASILHARGSESENMVNLVYTNQGKSLTVTASVGRMPTYPSNDTTTNVNGVPVHMIQPASGTYHGYAWTEPGTGVHYMVMGTEEMNVLMEVVKSMMSGQ